MLIQLWERLRYPLVDIVDTSFSTLGSNKMASYPVGSAVDNKTRRSRAPTAK